MGKIPVRKQVRPGPQRQRKEQRMARDGGKARLRGVECLAPAKGKGLRRTDTASDNHQSYRHREVRNPAGPLHLRPKLHIGGAPGGSDHPDQQGQRDHTIGSEIDPASDRADQPLSQAAEARHEMAGRKKCERKGVFGPAGHASSASFISRMM